LATLPQAAPSQVKLTCWPWHGSLADTVKVNDAVTPVVEDPLLGLMLKLRGASACAEAAVAATSTSAEAIPSSHRVEMERDMSARLSSRGVADPVPGSSRHVTRGSRLRAVLGCGAVAT
jgi:hypothetical protein